MKVRLLNLRNENLVSQSDAVAEHFVFVDKSSAYQTPFSLMLGSHVKVVLKG